MRIVCPRTLIKYDIPSPNYLTLTGYPDIEDTASFISDQIPDMGTFLQLLLPGDMTCR